MSSSETSQLNQSPEMVSGRNHEKEVSHVQISNPQLDPHVLRALNGGAAQVRRPLESPADFVSRHLGHVLSHHQGIVVEALRNELSLFAGAPLVDDTPLWIRLVHRERGGLRQVSPDWISAADNFLSRLGISLLSSQLVEASTQDPFLAYRLGQHGLAGRLATSRTDRNARALIHRIAIASDTLDSQILSELRGRPATDGEAESLLASYVVQQVKRGRVVAEGDIGRLESWVRSRLETSCDDDTLARVCHILNSLNFVWLNLNRTDNLERTIQQVETIGSKVSEVDLRAHILGNAFFHRSILAKLRGGQEQELSCLMEAARLDYGFTDYNYRIAQILHERGRSDAREQYEAAIRTSPFNLAVVNDYGVFLSERGTADELRSWEAVATFFFQAEGAGDIA